VKQVIAGGRGVPAGRWRGPVAVVVVGLGLAMSSSGAAHAAAFDVEALGRHVFVAGRASTTIAAIDARTDQVVARLELGLTPHQFVLAEDQRLLVATGLAERRLVLLDLAAGGPPQAIELDLRPERIQLDERQGMVAVADPAAGAVALIDLAERRLRQRLAGFEAPADLLFDREGRLLVASGRMGAIDLVDVAQGRIAGRIMLDPPAPGIRDLARTPGGEVALALRGASGLVSVIDLTAGRQVASVALPGPAIAAFPAANSQFFLVPSGSDGTVSRISSWTYRESVRLPAGPAPGGISLGLFDTAGFALSEAADEIAVLDLAADRPAGTIALPGRPATGSTAEAGTKLYVALPERDQVAVVDLAQRRLAGLIDGIGAEPWAVQTAGGLDYCH
jgi:DNA-binding beta-propeller fold protein YncE